jgi:hypothetical protein
MLWGTSSLALYIPWAGTSGPYLGLSLWLWLGVLDAVQGVGLGMILLQVRCVSHFTEHHPNLFLDFVTSARVCYSGFLSDHRLRLCHGRTCDGAESYRSRERVP